MVVRVRRVRRRMRGVKGRREGRSTPGPGLVVEGWGTSEKPGGMEGRGRSNKNFELVQTDNFLQLQTETKHQY